MTEASIDTSLNLGDKNSTDTQDLLILNPWFDGIDF